MSADIQVQQIAKLLSQLDETLRMALNTTGTDLKSLASAISKGNEIADKKENSGLSVAMQLSKEQKADFDILKSEIIRSAEEVTQGYTSALQKSEQGMRNEFGEQYVAKSELGEYKSQTDTAFEQTSKDISLQAKNLESIQTELSQYFPHHSG